MAFWIALGMAVVMMLIIPLCVIANRRHWGQRFHESAWHHMWWGVVFFGLFMLVAGLTTTGYTDPRNYNSVSEVELQALRTDSNIEGHFFLASGTVKEKTTYGWLQKADDGIITSDQIENYRAFIIEGGERAVLERRYLCGTWTFPWGSCYMPAYVFHVPPGSVLNTYEVTP